MLQLLFLLPVGFTVIWVIRQLFKKFGYDSFEEYQQMVSETNTIPTSEADPSDGLAMTIVFASQSGTAQGFADEMRADARKQGFIGKVVDIEEYETEALESEELVVFIVATYGEGDPTDSALDFMEWVMDSQREPELYENLRYAVFGLGNRQYEFFNKQGQVLDDRMNHLGAQRIVQRGVGDDDGNLEDDWEAWKSLFWKKTAEIFDLSVKVEEDVFQGSFRVQYIDKEVTPLPLVAPHDAVMLQLQVKENRELRHFVRGLCQSTRHIELELPEGSSYTTADNAAILARNDWKLVSKCAKRLGYDLKATFILKPLGKLLDKKPPIQFACSVQDALLFHCDLTSAPRKKLLKTLAQFASVEEDAVELKAMGDGSEGYTELVENQRYNIVDILEKYRSVDLPLEYFLELMPRLQPRYFTIASSSKADASRIHVTVAVVEEELPLNRMFKGVCSNYISSLRPDVDSLYCFLRPSSFRLPLTPVPVIMVGPGTGVAPMRAFIQEKSVCPEGKGEFHLYFGCRYRDHDFIYKDELEDAVEQRVLNRLVVAFSREQEEKVYVQDKIKEDSELVWSLIERGAYVYVCGATAMGKSVREAFISAFSTCGGMTEQEAVKKLHLLQEEHRYVQELWG